MKHIISYLLVVGASSVMGTSHADEADELLQRQNTLTQMEYKRDQLKIQAEMAMAVKSMRDAGVIMNQDGMPQGFESWGELAQEVRAPGRSHQGESNPFLAAGTVEGAGAVPFMPQSFADPSPGGAFQQLQGDPNGHRNVGQALRPDQSAERSRPQLTLRQIRGDSVVIGSAAGEQLVRVGEKVHGLTLQRYTVDQAFLKGPEGTVVLSIDWSKADR
ncbi:hypothetical protein [Pseudomonas guariconensis]|uniref:hypothetical protein n=1 Tax=Pseudomonas guariconensis TaxID=1288410 RepID=UPI003905CAC2